MYFAELGFTTGRVVIIFKAPLKSPTKFQQGKAPTKDVPNSYQWPKSLEYFLRSLGDFNMMNSGVYTYTGSNPL